MIDMTPLTEPLVELALTFLGLALTWASMSLKNYITEKVSNEKTKGALMLVHDHLQTAMDKVYSDMSGHIKDAAEGGFTKEELGELKAETLVLAKKHLGAKSISKLMDKLDFDTEAELSEYLESKIVSMGGHVPKEEK